ncbi:ubinuclein-1-like [Seriola aureovittata]|uniref:ubinuclein-1-like n=1 Tax=Seriola aureovittata TaxID=2871759 RepID=UPI0024BD7F71|nr:ubinuclein-1-like [Seriola aureovittata]XP_056222623.1 ubinuclein-1-like [Seriola aureovittata]
MAESRRVQLTTLPCDVPPSPPDPPASEHESSSSVLRGKDTGSDRTADTDTVRLILPLFEPDERSFPQFSYSQLIDNKINHTKAKDPLSKYEEEEGREDDEVAAIARKLEEKYGGKPTKKKDRIQDLIDIGYGYDEDDSFIDNSEAYDEFVPASITTKFGGFYVNSGVLQFRQASDTETENLTTEEKTLESSKKRKLNAGQDKPKKKQCRADEESRAKSSTLSELELNKKKKKKKKAVGTLSVTSMLKKFQREKEKERQKMEKANQRAAGIISVPTIPLCPADAAGGGGSGLTDPLLSLIGSTNDHALIQAASTVDFVIDLVSLLDASEETSSPKLVPQAATETQLFQPKTNNHSLTQAQPPNTKTNLERRTHPEPIQLLSEAGSTSLQQCAPLPEGLTPALEDSIRKLVATAKTSEGGSKLKFFTPEINSILLDIELQCREQGGQLRSKVYTHLSSFLPCSRDALLKRVKRLFLTHMKEPPDVEDPVQKLKEAIGKAMPEQIACYQANCQAYEHVKASKATEEGNEGKQSVKDGTEDNVEERGGKRGGPKKFFKWNEEIRECLCHVLRPKMDKYKNERKGSQEMEEYLKMLLDSEVKPLWPKGWMQSWALMRESRKLLGLFTSLPVKKARSDKKQSSVGGACATVSDVLQGTPPLEVELLQDTDDVFIVTSNICNSMQLGVARTEAAASKKMESKIGGGVTVDAGSSTPAESGGELRVNATSAPTHSLLDLLADQALAREQPLRVSQELLAAAVAKYKRSVQHWSFEVDTKNLLPPPPAPQSSPVGGLPVSGVCQVVFPQLLPTGNFAGHVDADQIEIISDDSDIIVQ